MRVAKRRGKRLTKQKSTTSAESEWYRVLAAVIVCSNRGLTSAMAFGHLLLFWKQISVRQNRQIDRHTYSSFAGGKGREQLFVQIMQYWL